MTKPAQSTTTGISPEQIRRTLVLATGEKGGVGKSTLARLLCDYFAAQGIQQHLFDADDANPTLSRFQPAAEQLLLSAKGLEPLVNWLELPQPVALVDTGARAGRALQDYFGQTGFLDLAAQFDARVVICFALAPSADSIGLLKNATEAIGGRASWVIARSTFVPGSWALWEGSKTRTAVESLGAVEIVMPSLDADAFSAMDRLSLSSNKAVEDKRLSLVYRAYVHRWRGAVFAEFDRVRASLLGQ